MDHDFETDPELMDYLQQLQPVPERNPQQTARARAAFLQEADQLSSQGISGSDNQRHNMWKEKIQSAFQFKRKENNHMFGTFTTLLIVLGMVFSGGGVTVAAAQGSLPDQTLYPVKMFTEDLLTNMTTDPKDQVNLILQYASRRADELQTMIDAGETLPDSVLVRLQSQIELALKIAANQPAETGNQLMEKIRERLQEQDQLMLHLETKAGPEAGATLSKTRSMIEERLQWVNEGLEDQIRLQDHLRIMDGSQPSTGEATPANNSPAQNGPQQFATEVSPRNTEPGKNGPQNGNTTSTQEVPTAVPPVEIGNPWVEGTPTPGSSYGPGPGTGLIGTCTPSLYNNYNQSENSQPAESGSGDSSSDGGNTGGKH